MQPPQLRPPDECPYCDSVVIDTDGYTLPGPADDRGQYWLWKEKGDINLHPGTTPGVDCRRFVPCGHLFTHKDLRRWMNDRFSLEELAECVRNPDLSGDES